MPLKYLVFKLENQQSSPVSVHDSLVEAKSLGEEIIQQNSQVWIDCMPLNSDPKKPSHMNSLRFDKDINDWIETSLPICYGEFY